MRVEYTFGARIDTVQQAVVVIIVVFNIGTSIAIVVDEVRTCGAGVNLIAETVVVRVAL